MRLTARVAVGAMLLFLGAGCIDSSLSVNVNDAAVDGGADVGKSSEDAKADQVSDSTATDVAEVEVVVGKNCYEAMTCLTEFKEWAPGISLPESPCLEGIEETEMIQVDGVNGCMHQHCNDEFEAWKVGGPGEESLLYLCLIEKCSNPSSVCIGGQGEDTCADALKCMAKCQPMDQECTVPCLVETSDYQSEKTGKFLECVFAECALSDLGDCYDVQSNCAMQFCLELAGF